MAKITTKPKETTGREWERWQATVTDNVNRADTDLFNYLEATASLTLDDTHGIVDCSVAGITITIPLANARNRGKSYTIDNSSSGNITASGAIEGETSQVVPPDCCMQIYSTGSKWRIK